MKKITILFIMILSAVSYSQSPLPNQLQEFLAAIDDCLATNPVDGLCTESDYGPMPDWDVSNVMDMQQAFINKEDFNADISKWDVGLVSIMRSMFFGANSFNQDITGWNTVNVTVMDEMFYEAYIFNQSIGTWDTGIVTDMDYMFYKASAFNGDISNWCVTNVVLEPAEFSTDSQLSESNTPLWGTCPTAGVDDQNQLDISIYPNPTSDIVYIDGNYSQLKIVICDILGKQVIKESITNSLDISHLEKGVYILQLSDGIKLTTQRIIKN